MSFSFIIFAANFRNDETNTGMKNFVLLGIILSVMCSCDTIESGGGSGSSSKVVAYVRQGMSDYGTVIYTYDGHYIRQGMGAFGTVVWTYDGHYIRQGMGDYGTVIWTYDGHYIRQGMGDYGKVVYTFDGHYIRSGMGDYGSVLYTIDYK